MSRAVPARLPTTLIGSKLAGQSHVEAGVVSSRLSSRTVATHSRSSDIEPLLGRSLGWVVESMAAKGCAYGYSPIACFVQADWLLIGRSFSTRDVHGPLAEAALQSAGRGDGGGGRRRRCASVGGDAVQAGLIATGLVFEERRHTPLAGTTHRERPS